MVDENAPHRLGSGEEVAAAVPSAVVGGADEPEVRLVDQRGGVEGLAGRLGGHPRGGEPAQLVLDEREQVGGGAAVPGRRGVEQARHLEHGGQCNGAGRPARWEIDRGYAYRSVTECLRPSIWRCPLRCRRPEPPRINDFGTAARTAMLAPRRFPVGVPRPGAGTGPGSRSDRPPPGPGRPAAKKFRETSPARRLDPSTTAAFTLPPVRAEDDGGRGDLRSVGQPSPRTDRQTSH